MAGDDFAVEAFTLLAIAIVTIAIRIVARWFTAGWKNFMLDDYLMPLAGVCACLSPPPFPTPLKPIIMLIRLVL